MRSPESSRCLTPSRALDVAEAAERHARLRLAGTSPADKATVTVEAYADVFLGAAAIEANSKEAYARHLDGPVVDAADDLGSRVPHGQPGPRDQAQGRAREFKIDHAVSRMVREHIALHAIGPGQAIFPVRLLASTEAAGRDPLTQEDIDALGFTEEQPNGLRYKHGTLGWYVTAKCRCRECGQWSADCARDRKRRRTGRSAQGVPRGGCVAADLERGR